MNQYSSGRKSRRGLSTLGQCVNRITAPALRRRGFAEAAIVTRWDEIVGRPLCDHSQPSRVVFPRGQRRDGVLHLVVTGAFAPEVLHLAPQIVERINVFFGFPAVARLQLHHGPVSARHAADRSGQRAASGPELASPPDPGLDAVIAAVQDDSLKSALDRLVKSRRMRRPAH